MILWTSQADGPMLEGGEATRFISPGGFGRTLVWLRMHGVMSFSSRR